VVGPHTFVKRAHLRFSDDIVCVYVAKPTESCLVFSLKLINTYSNQQIILNAERVTMLGPVSKK